ncbi:MAG: 4-(cytidine 5'-diphospho)-2-C-methyl-D-erythritol kinase [Chitinophagaceae bacterium]|nr:4-(cytidine 5'-diphospho)-2-C-methyl-D-erythritol kinase [Chitinophagaceae bacterium]
MIVFPNCKINLGLHILSKRDDGFHDLETVFCPINFTEALEVISNPASHSDTEFTATGLKVDGSPSDNLCIKAYQLLKKDIPQLAAVKIHLHKTIPTGAGLGGGSADAAFMLKLLNDKFKLNLSTPELLNYALQLGSDCPFFIINKPCFATGRGESLEEISLDLSPYKIVLINPNLHVNTGWAFSQISPAMPKRNLKEIVGQPIATWKEELKNDFEEAVSAAHPRIKLIKEYLYRQGAIYAAMSGSGSTVFGIFDKATPVAHSGNDFFQKIIN